MELNLEATAEILLNGRALRRQLARDYARERQALKRGRRVGLDEPAVRILRAQMREARQAWKWIRGDVRWLRN